MIYSFEKENSACRDFLSELKNNSLDFEIIRRDKVVIRIFGHVDSSLKERLESLSKNSHNLTLKKSSESVTIPDQMNKLFIAGPCSVESESQLSTIAEFLARQGIGYLRGGAFKPRTQSSSFQGLGRVGLKIMADVAARNNMKVVTELMDRSQLDDVERHADIIQVGSRNMFNYTLLTALGSINKPILLKRGMAATIDEWIHAADYIRKGGNENVILCERGIRTFEPRTRFTLDILAIPLAQKLSGLKVIADPSHAAGNRDLVPHLVKAALAAGADGVMVEVHHDPEEALSDGAQSMSFTDYSEMLNELKNTGLFFPINPANKESIVRE
ncbi:MAG: 3-deoxy-7-phosphoheptulonate synthase [candidate division Zixibacteria bacterium]|nr:3-deoxy-7-phosphoheptulonate synthase [candidate division Zixibacteria bacterium]